MEIDRLKELKGADVTIEMGETKAGETKVEEKKETNGTTPTNSEISAHMELYDVIRESLNVIKDNVQRVEKLKDRDRKTANEKERKGIMHDLEKIMDQTNANAARIKKRLEEIKADNEKFAVTKEAKNSAKMQMRVNLYQTHIRRFHQLMNEYNQVSHEFRQALQDRTRRQLKIVDKNITDDEVEKIVESGKAAEVIKQALVSEELEDVVRDIEERHQEILKLERQVQEVFELFRDLAALVDIQQDSLDVISTRVSNAKNYTERAEVQLKDAENYQKKARRRQCMLLGVVLVIMIVIMAPILGTQLKSS